MTLRADTVTLTAAIKRSCTARFRSTATAGAATMSPWTMSRRLRIGKPRCLILCPATGVTTLSPSHARSLAIPRLPKIPSPPRMGRPCCPIPVTAIGTASPTVSGASCSSPSVQTTPIFPVPPCRMNPAASRWSKSSGRPVRSRLAGAMSPGAATLCSSHMTAA